MTTAAAFITPVPVRVREAASAGGHWITLHAAESDEGTVHVFIGGNGRVTKGPSSLVGSAIGHLASHPSVTSAEHHPPGHEPAGATSHPRYTEHQPPEKPAPLPGKPYARLHGAPQTRQEQPKQGPEPLTKEQTHAGLQQAREQAKAVTTASPEASPLDHPDVDHAAVAHFASHLFLPVRGQKVRDALARDEPLSHKGKAVNDATRKAVAHVAAEHDREGRALAAFGKEHAAAQAKADAQAKVDAHAAETAKHRAGHAVAHAAFRKQQEDAWARTRAFTQPTPEAEAPEDKAADAAVQSQQAQADLAAYRASKDRNPNPWAPHLSPPVNDAKDRELQEKATRAQLAHQSVQAQQQQAAAAQQQEGQRAHDKEMVRLKAEAQQAAKPALAPLPAKAAKPGEITKEHIQAKVMAGEHLTREEKGFVLNGYRMPKPKPEEPTEPQERTPEPKAAQTEPALSAEEQQQVGRAVDRWKSSGPSILHEMAQRHEDAAGRGGENLSVAAHREAARRLRARAGPLAAPAAKHAETPATVRPSKPSDKPWDYVSPAEQKRRAGAKAEGEKKAAQDERARLEAAAIHHASTAHEAFTKERAQSHAAHLERMMAEHREKYGEEANRGLQELVSTARSAGRRHAGERFASQSVHADVEAARQRQQQPKAQAESGPAPTAPTAKAEEKPAEQTTAPERDLQWHQNRLAAAANAHQEAIEALSWHRARHDPTFASHHRPSKSPPVGDETERELVARLERASGNHRDAIDRLLEEEKRATGHHIRESAGPAPRFAAPARAVAR